MVKGITRIENLNFEKAPSRARRVVRDGDTIISTVRTYLKAIASIKNPTFVKVKQVERTTSVKMRKVYIVEEDPAEFKDVIEFIKPEIRLCRELHPSKLPIAVQWSVNAEGKVSNVVVNHPQKGQGQQLSECVRTVVNHFAYPLLVNNSSFSHTKDGQK